MISRILSFFSVLAAMACSEGGQQPSPQPVNIAPVASAGADLSAAEGEAVSLSGGESSDTDGSIAAFEWSQTSGPAAILNDAATSTPSFIAPLVNASASLTFELTVTDDNGARAVDSVTVTVDPAPRSQPLEIPLVFDGEGRVFTVYTPATYTAGSAAVLLLHGGSQSMRKVLEASASTSRWLTLAEQHGFLLIAPNGYSEANSGGFGEEQSWNDLRDDQSGRTSLQDDVGFILSVLDVVQTARGHDAARTFSTGSSNGGMMTMRLLVEEPGRIAGAAVFIAALPQETIPDPLLPTPILIYNGTDDPLVLFGGGPVSNGGAPTRSVPDTLDYFLRANDADTAGAVDTMLPDNDPGDNCEIFETQYFTLSDGSPSVFYYEGRGGGHAIPDPDAAPFSPAVEAVIGNRCRDVEGVDLAYEFFTALP